MLKNSDKMLAMQYRITAEKFKKHFGMDFKEYVDETLYNALDIVCVDIIKFDDYLHERCGRYEDCGKSMKDVITELYGKEASEFFESLIDGVEDDMYDAPDVSSYGDA